MNFDTNTVPRSETTTWGIPCLAYTSSRRIFAHPSDVSSVEHATGIISLEKRSTITRIASWPLLLGNPVTMSTEMCIQGRDGISFGWSGAALA